MKVIADKFIPSKIEMLAWSKKIYDQGIRRPGYSADKWVEEWIKNQFRSYNLENINLDPVNIKQWDYQRSKLKFWLKDNPDDIYQIPCFPIPYTTSKNSVEAELVLFSKEISMENKIAVSEITLFELPIGVLKRLVKADRWYDPEKEFKNLNQLLPFDLTLGGSIDSAFNNKAIGYIGILSGFPWETDNYYVPYDAIVRDKPGVWISRTNGKKILQLMKKGIVFAELSYKSSISDAISYNITATLPGISNEWVLIGTHHDGPWASAVEDASGISLVLAQAKYWSQVPETQRPFNLMFVFNCGHMAGAKGNQTFVEKNKIFLQNAVCAIHLEHVARDVMFEDSKMIPMDLPTVRWWFTSRILSLEEIVENAIIKEELKRSIILPPDGFPPNAESMPTDGHYYHLAGIPVVSFLTAPPYLFDTSDTLDKIHEESFVPLTRAVIRIINGLKDHTTKDLRSKILSKQERNKIRRRIKIN